MLLKQKIKCREKTSGMLVNLNDVVSSRIAGLAGYDFIWIDMEHSPISMENLQNHIIAVKAGGTDVIVRVPQNDLTATKKVLEMGVDGIVFPMVRSAAEARELVAATLYPPYGNRGFGPQQAIKFGFDDAVEYVAQTCENLCRFIQIEHVDAVNDLENMVQNEYIDGYIFGPNDLSGSIGEPLSVYGENTIALIEKSMNILKKAGKYSGLATGDISDACLQYWHDMGIEMLAAGADFEYLREMSLRNRLNLDRIHKNIDCEELQSGN